MCFDSWICFRVCIGCRINAMVEQQWLNKLPFGDGITTTPAHREGLKWAVSSLEGQNWDLLPYFLGFEEKNGALRPPRWFQKVDQAVLDSDPEDVSTFNLSSSF